MHGHSISDPGSAGVALLAGNMSDRMRRDFESIQHMAPRHLMLHAPHVLKKVSNAWGTLEVVPYLDSVMMTDRVARAGFLPEVLSDLFFLSELHEFLYPSRGANPVGVSLPAPSRPNSLSELLEQFDRYRKPRTRHPENWRKVGTRGARSWGEISSLEELTDRLKNDSAVAARPPAVGETLIAYGLISERQFDAAVETLHSERGGHRTFEEILVQEHGLVAEDITKALCLQRGFLLLDLDAIPMTEDAFSLITRELALDGALIPVVRADSRLVVAFQEPLQDRSAQTAATIERHANVTVVMSWAPSAAIERRLLRYEPGWAEKAA